MAYSVSQVESDAEMATRLQREEDARAGSMNVPPPSYDQYNQQPQASPNGNLYPQQQQQNLSSYPRQQYPQQQQNFQVPPGMVLVPAHLVPAAQQPGAYPQSSAPPQTLTPQPSLPPRPTSSSNTLTPNTSQQAAPAQEKPYPFNTPFTTLTIVPKNTSTTLLIPPHPTQPLYSFQHTPSSNFRQEPHVKVYHHSPSPKSPRLIGTAMFHSYWTNKFTMSVLGLDWEFDTFWVFDVGTISGRELEWTIPQKSDTPSVSFRLECVEREDRKVCHCRVEMRDFERGEMRLCIKVLDEQRKLDEMVVVSCAAMQRMRTKIRKHGARSVGSEAAGGKGDPEFAKSSFKAGWQVAALASGGGGGGA